MILSDKSIERELSLGDLEVNPFPDAEQIQPASLDVTLGEWFIDPTTGDEFQKDEVTLEPGDTLLGTTVEIIGLPNDLAAQLTGRSSVGRLFVTIHQTAGWLDPGWRGQVTLEISNDGNEEQVLTPGDRVGQLVFFPLDQASRGYKGQYQGQMGPEESGEV